MEQIELMEVFNKFSSGELELDVCAKNLSSGVLKLLEDQQIAGEDRMRFKNTWVSLDQKANDFKVAVSRERLGQPGANTKREESEFKLRQCVLEVHEILFQYMKKQEFNRPEEKVPKEKKPYERQIQDDTIKQYLDRIKENPNDHLAYNGLGNYYFSSGEYDEAIKQYKKAISKNPNVHIYHSNIGDSYKMLKDLDESINWYKKALDIRPTDDIVNNSVGIVYFYQKDYGKAIEYYQKAMGYNPTAAYSLNIGDVYSAQKKDDIAIEYYENAKLLEAKYPDAYYTLSLSYLNKYNETRNKNFLNQAQNELNEAINLKPDSYEFHAARGILYSKMNEWDKSIESYKKSLELNPDYYVSYGGIGNALYNKGEYNKAIKQHKKALSIKPESCLDLQELGDCYKALKNLKEAIKFYKKALDLNSNNAITLNALGLTYQLKCDFDKAITYYEKAIEIDSGNFIYYTNMGLAYSHKGRYDEAIDSYKGALELENKDNKTHSALAYAYIMKGLFNQALKHLEEAININPADPINYEYGSGVYQRLKKWNKAEEYAKLSDEKAKAINPDDTSYVKNIGDVFNAKGLQHYNAKQYNEAIEEFKKAVKVIKRHSYYWNIYQSFYNLGKYKEAKTFLIKAIEIKTNPMYLEALEDPKLQKGE